MSFFSRLTSHFSLKKVNDGSKLFPLSFSLLPKSKPKPAFTLAEVLITLLIIGVIAAYTVPILVNTINDSQYKVAYKKAFSDANNAWLTCINNNEIEVKTTFWSDTANTDNFMNFMNKFSVSKSCLSSNTYQCWNSSGEYMDGIYPGSDNLAFVDSSGRVWVLTICTGVMYVDINGNQSPNVFGKDRFPLMPVPSNYSNYGYRAYSGNDSATLGFPDMIIPYQDNNHCPNSRTNCYFYTWLFK